MMTEQEFDARMKQIDAAYAGRREGAVAYRDQEMARLFSECEWTQERIATRMKRKQSWVSQRLKFGAFLNFITDCDNHPPLDCLTEGRFRALYARTKGKEKERFADVLTMLDEESQPPGYRRMVNKPGIKAAIQELLTDGGWHTTRQIRVAVTDKVPEATSASVSTALRNLQARPPDGFFVEARHSGRVHQYRLRKDVLPRRGSDPAVFLTRLIEGIGPIIEELKHWGRAHEYQMSPVAIRRIASRLEKLFSPLTQEVDA